MRRWLLLLCLLADPASAQTAITIPPNQFGLPALTLPGVSGPITPPSAGFPATTCSAPGIYLTSATTTGVAFTATPSVLLCVNGSAVLTVQAASVTTTTPMVFSGGSILDGIATANTVEQRNGTSPQIYRVFNTDNGGNDEWAEVAWVGTDFKIRTQNTGAGVFRAIQVEGPNVTFRTGATYATIANTWQVEGGGDLVSLNDALAFGWSDVRLQRGAANRLDVASGDFVRIAPVAVAALPTCNAGAQGSRFAVTDSNTAYTAGIGAVVAAGGANVVPVFCDGANWRIG